LIYVPKQELWNEKYIWILCPFDKLREQFIELVEMNGSNQD
jgi:hypothetical protein